MQLLRAKGHLKRRWLGAILPALPCSQGPTVSSAHPLVAGLGKKSCCKSGPESGAISGRAPLDEIVSQAANRR
jgi:hypothetical protein